MAERKIAVIGGGVAGIAAAIAARDGGAQVELYEALPQLGGRVAGGEGFDTGRHLALSVYREFLRLCYRLGSLRQLHFQRLQLGAWADDAPHYWRFGRSPARTVRNLWHASLLPGRARLPALFALSRSLLIPLRETSRQRLLSGMARFDAVPGRDAELAWRRLRWPQSLRERVGRPAMLGICNGPPERTAIAPLLLALRRMLLDGPVEAGWPTLDQGSIISKVAPTALAGTGVGLHLSQRVRALERERGRWIVRAEDTGEAFDRLVLTLPPWQLQNLDVDDTLRPLLDQAAGLKALGIATLRGRFQRGQALPGPMADDGEESAIWFSTRLPDGQLLVEQVVSGIDPAVPPDLEAMGGWFLKQAQEMLGATQLVGEVEPRYYPRATPLLEPGTARPRIWQAPGLAYASDWSATGLPPTLEAAARAGFIAGHAVARD